jgi:lipid-binding SYLF domain-containing protein
LLRSPGLTTPPRAEIDRDVREALGILYEKVPGSKGVEQRASGVLVFPSIFKAGFIVGAEFGKGALQVRGKSVGYYSSAAGSVGLQAGAERHAVAVMFMTPEALQHFEASSGWDIGADASVTLVNVGASGSIDASTPDGRPIAGGNEGFQTGPATCRRVGQHDTQIERSCLRKRIVADDRPYKIV